MSTPLPWDSKEGQVYCLADGKTLAVLHHSDQRDADANLIVLAVNNHAALIACVQDLIDALTPPRPGEEAIAVLQAQVLLQSINL